MTATAKNWRRLANSTDPLFHDGHLAALAAAQTLRDEQATSAAGILDEPACRQAEM
ncbi:hypothetical protein ACTVZO_40115 [Streptomyces sp. IBSNAI002]|uniref:hypothetical protein n=1 Tax=Streptomyces sp. IBSNAI002 TaxID=3457500 RepID=UPI003FD4A599